MDIRRIIITAMIYVAAMAHAAAQGGRTYAEITK